MRPANVLAVLLASAFCLASAAAAQAQTAVAVYPLAGSSYNAPGAQIAFRGIPASQLGAISVVGSSSGPHTGHIAPDSDGNGGSFLPDKSFRSGETVTVTTSLNVIGGRNGTFSFKIEQPSWPIKPAAQPVAPAGSNGLQHFRSRPDLLPPSVWVSKNAAPSSQGDIFLTPQFGPAQNGPMILDASGNLLWFSPNPVSRRILTSDLRVQQLFGQPVLTWWQGYSNNGTGEGQGMILDQNYHQVATVRAGNGMQMDLHEFLVTPEGQAYILAFSPLNIPSIVHKPLLDGVVQEVDIRTGLVLFEWHALDHIPLGNSYFPPRTPGFVFDPYHINSVSIDRDGNLLVSMRNTSAVYKINRGSGRILWQLGGKHSSFRMGRGASTAFQHTAVVQPDGTLTIFDDGAGPPTIHPYSRGIRVALDTKRMRASLIRTYGHSPQISSSFEGGVQQLSAGDVFMGWGQLPYFSEDDGAGHQIFDAHFVAPTSSYRAYRFPWSGQPTTIPALAAGTGSGGASELWASWNGATNVAAWRMLAGSSPGSLVPIGQAPRRGFETAMTPGSEAPFLEVQPLDASGNPLATSSPVRAPAHVVIYGRSAFVPPVNGFGGLPVGCFTGKACRLTTAITSGRSVLARSGAESMAAGATGLVYFRLSPGARTALARSRSGRLSVSATVSDASGMRASTPLTLVGFSTRGSGPPRHLTPAPQVSLVGATDFVNSKGIGGLLTACHSAVTPCPVRATLSAGGTTIAHTGQEYVGAGDLGNVIFTLTPAGRAMLARAPGNQLGVQAQVASGGSVATGRLALVRFS